MNLSEMLDQYRRGERGLPSYDELRVFAEADAAARAAPGVPAASNPEAFEAAMRAKYPLFPLDRQSVRDGDETVCYVSAGTQHAWNGYCLAAPAGINQQAGGAVPELDLMDMLANHGGSIVNTASLDGVQIAAARIENRMYVREDGCGFVHLPLTTTPTKRERELDASLDRVIGQRDGYYDWADHFANAIAKHFDMEIGEHTSMNCPWVEALHAIESADAAPLAVPVQADRMPETAAKPADGSDPMPNRSC